METTPSRQTIAPGFPWKVFWVLAVACLLGFAAALPYVYALYRELIARGPLPMPMPVLVTVQLMLGPMNLG